MKKMILAIVMLGIAGPLAATAQDADGLKDYMRTLLIGPGLQVKNTHL